MTNKNNTLWAELTDPVKTILERIDINGIDAGIKIDEEVDIPYFKGIFTSEMAQEIYEYQNSIDNEGYFSASIENNVLHIKFFKRAF